MFIKLSPNQHLFIVKFLISNMEKEEVQHFIEVLHSTHTAITKDDSLTLKELSNQTVHSASTYQDSGSITIAVLVYTLSKLIERKEHMKIKGWEKFVRRIDSFLSLAEKALRQDNIGAYENYLKQARKSLTIISASVKPYLDDVLEKALINKSSKIYEHGISLGKAAELLGLSQWEVTEYIAQKSTADANYNRTLDVKKRADLAMQFFS